MVKVCALSTGSSGNSFFISDGKTRLLIDAGISRPEIDKRMMKVGEDSMNLDGCLLTHEHTDHISGIRGLATRYQIRMYCTDGTQSAIEQHILDTAMVAKRLVVDCAHVIGTMAVMPIDIPHDANEPVGYFIRANGRQIAFVTDLAYICDPLAQMLQTFDVVFLECNHDIDGLAASCYPEYLKKRVRESHLSNDQVCEFLRASSWKPTQRIILGHLSRGSNDPALVHAMAIQALRSSGTGMPKVTVLPHGAQSEVFTF